MANNSFEKVSKEAFDVSVGYLSLGNQKKYGDNWTQFYHLDKKAFYGLKLDNSSHIYENRMAFKNVLIHQFEPGALELHESWNLSKHIKDHLGSTRSCY